MSEQPNIILIHGHDLGRWLSCYNMPSVPSPNLKALAERAVVFEKAFAVAPLCTPARSALFSGLMPHQNGLMGLTHNGWSYRDDVRTLPQILGELGYDTALIGLQHEDLDPRQLGFDEVHGMGFLPRAMEVARRAEWWLAQDRAERPFFATIGMWEGHRPWPNEDYEPADPDLVDVPAYLPDNAETRRDISEFHGAIKQLDDAVGMILSALERSAHADNTMVIFTTDHGAAFPRAKSTLYDSGVEVALVVQPPRSWHAQPRREDAIVSHLDIVPTLIEIAGGEISPELEGESFRTALTDDSALRDDRELILEKTFHDRYDPIRAIRTRDAKYIRNYASGPKLPLPIDLEESFTRSGMGDDHEAPRPVEELYLLASDPDELEDVAEDPAYVDLKQRLSERLSFHLHRMDDPILDGPVEAPRVELRRS